MFLVTVQKSIISAGMCYTLTCFGIPLWPDIWRPSGWYCRSGNDYGPYRSWTRRLWPPRPLGSGSDQSGTPCSVSAGEKNLCLSRLGKKIVYGEWNVLLAVNLSARVISPPAQRRKSSSNIAQGKRVIYYIVFSVPSPVQTFRLPTKALSSSLNQSTEYR